MNNFCSSHPEKSLQGKATCCHRAWQGLPLSSFSIPQPLPVPPCLGFVHKLNIHGQRVEVCTGLVL